MFALAGLLAAVVLTGLALSGSGCAGQWYRYLPTALAGLLAGFMLGKGRRELRNPLSGDGVTENSAFMQMIIDHIPAPIYLKDSKGKYIFVNRQYELLTGLERETIIAADDFALFPEEIASLFRSQDEEVLESGRPLEFEECVELATGTRSFITLKFPLLDENNRPHAVGGFCTDITHRLETEKELEVEKNFSIAVLESLPGIFYVCDAECRLVRWNRNLEELLSRSAGELAGSSVEEWFAEADRELFRKGFRRVLESGRLQGRLYLNLRDGRRVPFYFSACRLEIGDRSYVLGVASDVSREIRSRQALKQSYNFLQTVIDANPDPMMLVSPDHQIVLANTALASLSRFHQGDPVAKGLKCHQFLFNSDSLCSKTDCPIARVVASRKKIAITLRIALRGGGVGTFEALLAPVLNRSGEVVQVIASLRNISERIEAARRLQERESKIKTILQTAPTGIGVISNRVFREVNERFCRMVGYSEDELIGADFRMVFPSAEEYRRILRMQREHQQQDAGAVESRLKRKDGTLIDILVSWSPLNPHDSSAGMVFNTLDISRLKKLEEHLAQSQEMETIGKLAGGVAHDFNNILTVITNYSQLIQEKLEAGDPLLHYVEQIEKAGNLAADLTRKLLGFSRRQMILPELFDLNRMISEMSEVLERSISSEINLEFRLDDEAGMVYADPGQLKQVIMNLIANARDAVMEDGGGREKVIRIATAREYLDEKRIAGFQDDIVPGWYLKLVVEDNGIGMSEEVVAHIFEPFFTTKKVGRGSGMGLATVYGIVRQNRGALSCWSRPGEGTRFTIYWPPASDEKRASLPGSDTTDRTILVAEDNEQIREMISCQLRMAGYKVVEAENGWEVLERVRKQPGSIDLIFADVVMPVMDGVEMFERLREVAPEIPILFGSGYATENLPAGIFNRENFVSKPYDSREILSRIRRLLE